ncbi:unnamed protein product [Oppiella nova]|uniref:XPA C-terminal domain-containing protein n=1 Tax=Oppiella nova TaxID=334625 RepID=A0A7R9LID4_9ACAR|nr:unnamed protein product [Oppiella nova]CAG2163917.1 unnamed protein product [Oppiella nova]
MSAQMSTSGSAKRSKELTAEELSRIERNRQKALLLRQQKQQKLTAHELYSLEANHQHSGTGSQSTVGAHDSGGGFLVDSDDERDTTDSQSANTTADDNGVSEAVKCEECGQEFHKSFLWSKFSVKTCDSCRDLKDRHSLVTRTEAKSEYLLKDCDLDKRPPPLRYYAKKNPHEFARGDMKLYLRSQVEDRALEVWGSEEALEEERERRVGKGRKRKEKQYEKRLKSLRMSVRSSLYTRDTVGHNHDFDDEVYNEEEDRYEKRCKSCGHLDSYEKM